MQVSHNHPLILCIYEAKSLAKKCKHPIIILNYLKLSNRNLHLSIVAMAVDGNANKRHTAHQAIPFTL